MKIIQSNKPLSAYDCIVLVDVDPESWEIASAIDTEEIQERAFNLSSSVTYELLLARIAPQEPLQIETNVDIIMEKEHRSSILLWITYFDTSIFNDAENNAPVKIIGREPLCLSLTKVFLKGLAAHFDRMIDVVVIGFDISYYAEQINKIKQVSVKINPDYIFPTDGWVNRNKRYASNNYRNH